MTRIRLRRILGVTSCISGVVWGGTVGWAAYHPETEALVRIRTAAFVVMIGAAMLVSPSRSKVENTEDKPEEF